MTPPDSLQHADAAPSVDETERSAEAGQDRPTIARRLTVAGLVAGLLTVLCAVLMPLAPVTVNAPTVNWPNNPAAPQSTMLGLTMYKPLGLEADFSCKAARLAQGGQGGVLLATMDAGQPAAGANALVVAVRDGRVVVHGLGTKLLDESLPAGDCRYQVRGDKAGLVFSRDGKEIARGPANRLPDVSVLATSVAAIPGGTTADLGVKVRVDDQFDSSPTGIKIALTVLLVLAGAASLACLVLMDRQVRREPVTRPKRRFRLRVVDFAVPALMIIWVFLAPMSDDDGYYSAMAKNVEFEGYVGNYYQMFNNGFTPFTWFYYFLSKWQVFGFSPVVLRIPALLFGLITWVLLRKFVDGTKVLPEALRSGKWGGVVTRVVLAAAFLAWWLPLDMGVRPEGVVAMCGVGVLLAVVTAVERQRLALAGVAVLVGGLGFAAHPTGFTALAPLVAGIPALWHLLKLHAPTRKVLWSRIVCVIAPGAIAAVAGFADGTLADFLRSQQIFLGIQAQESWYTEWLRWGWLLSDIAMGSYAKRAAVLVCVVLLAWFILLMVAARIRKIPVSYRFWLAGWSIMAGLLLLWFTPSKWTHHFGSLAGIGSAFLAVMLLGAVPLVRELTKDSKLPVVGVIAAASSVVIALALAGHGPNSWPYSWLLGMPHKEEAPHVAIFKFDQPLWWALGLALLAVVIALRVRRNSGGTPEAGWKRNAVLVAVPALVVVFFAVNVVYLVGSFGLAAKRTWNTWSPWASSIQDPFARECGAAKAIDVLDLRNAQALDPVAKQPAASMTGFTEGSGWFPPYAPPAGGASAKAWGSLVRKGEEIPEKVVGKVTTSWYTLPQNLPRTSALSTVVAGRARGGNVITVEYGKNSPSGPQLLEKREVPDQGDGVTWRNVVLARGTDLPAGADAVRIVATDTSTDAGGWLAFTAPSVQRTVSLQQYNKPDTPLAVAWQFAFLFPCQRQPRAQDGILEPVQGAVLWGSGPLNGLGAAEFQTDRGGLFGQVPLSGTMAQLTAQLRDFPEQQWMQVYQMDPAFPAAQYKLTRDRKTVMGWQSIS